MIDPITLERWLYWALLSALGGAILFARLLPLEMSPTLIPGPDILLATAMAWVVRRPDFVPVLLVAVLFFVTGMMVQNIPGVWAALVVLGLEFLRRREAGLREQPFLFEWLMVAGTLVVMVVVQRMFLLIFMVEQEPMGRVFLQCLATIAIYPVMVFVSSFVLRIEKMQPGEDPVKRQAA